MEKFPYQRAAEALARLDYESGAAVAKSFNVTTRTLTNWRERLEWDEKLRGLYKEIIDRRIEKIIEEIPPTMRKMIRFLDSATEELDPADPDSVRAIIQAAESMVELLMILKRIS